MQSCTLVQRLLGHLKRLYLEDLYNISIPREVRLGWLEKTWLHFPETEGDGYGVTFDIHALIKYNGDGVCKSLDFGRNCVSANIYEETIGMWADSRIYWDFKMNYGDDEVRLSLERTFQMSFKT